MLLPGTSLEDTDLLPKGCEHFGDNVPKLACIQHEVSLKCSQR